MWFVVVISLLIFLMAAVIFRELHTGEIRFNGGKILGSPCKVYTRQKNPVMFWGMVVSRFTAIFWMVVILAVIIRALLRSHSF